MTFVLFESTSNQLAHISQMENRLATMRNETPTARIPRLCFCILSPFKSENWIPFNSPYMFYFCQPSSKLSTSKNRFDLDRLA